MSSLFVLLVMVAAASAVSNQVFFNPDNNQVAEWNTFKTMYGIRCSDAAEDKTRMRIYFMNKNLIDAHNKRYDLGLESYKLGINQFSGMTHKQYLNIEKGFKPPYFKERDRLTTDKYYHLKHFKQASTRFSKDN